MIIVMLGKLRSGKSTATNIVIEELSKLDVNLIRKPLAAPIYKEAEEFYARHGLTWRKNRKLMEGIGEALNDDYPNGDKIIELYSELFDPNKDSIIEDCRRLTQTTFFEKHNAIFIRIHTDTEVRKARCKPGEWSEGHITDTELDNYPVHAQVENNGEDMEEFRAKIVSALRQVGIA